MNRSEIIVRVLNCLDEAGVTQNVDPLTGYPMDNFLDESLRQLVKLVPIYTLKDNFVSFADAALTDNGDGSGSVTLPEGFSRLVAFRMEGWQRDATQLYDIYDPMYLKQSNPYLRGGVSHPVVVRDGEKLRYYSLPKGTEHAIARAEAICEVDIEEIDSSLIDALAWLTASKILDVLTEGAQANMAREQYAQAINLLRIC